jgi:hypothetical protein
MGEAMAKGYDEFAGNVPDGKELATLISGLRWGYIATIPS